MNQFELSGTSRSINCDDGVPNYCSSESEEENQDEPKPKRGRNKVWVFYNKFLNFKEAEDFVSTENTWSRKFTRMTEEGQKRFYRCNKVRKLGPQCAAELYLLFESGSDSVLVYRSEADHNHDEVGTRTNYGISDQTKLEINSLFDLHLKPKAILAALQKIDGIQLPTKKQLGNYLSDRRKIKFGQPIIHLGELEKWIIEHKNIPEDEDEPFVMKYWILESDQPKFRFALTTKKLLKFASSIDVLHVDATYKLIWQGFPVLIIGTTNKNRKFYPLCLGVATNEQKEDFELVFNGLKENILSLLEVDFKPKVLVSDAAQAIKNAFLEVFGSDTTVRMCWAHAIKNMKKKVDKTVEKKERKDIMEDIYALHNASSPEIFNAASQAFIVKHASKASFIKYFEQEWLINNPNWFLGAAATLSPTTNNALEAFNKSIKDHNTMRERFPLSRFLTVAKEMVTQWSNDINENSLPQTHEIELKEWTEGYRWARQNVKVKTLTSDCNKKVYLVPSEKMTATNMTYDYEAWHSFDEFKKKNFAFWKTELPSAGWEQGTCTCPQFFKVYICKHILGLAIRLKLTIPPIEAKSIPIGLKRKRGRPTKSKPALIMQ